MADLALRIMLEAQDMASKVVKDVGTALNGLGNNAGGMGNAINKATNSTNPLMSALQSVGTVAMQVGNVALHAVGDGVQFLGSQLEDSVKIAMAHQQVMSQTTQAIKSTGDASGLSAKQIESMATSMSQLTPFSEDTIQSGENLLLTFTNIGQKTFPAATQAMLDMSQAMHMGPTQAALQMGKALNDPLKGLTALQREGVTFTASEKASIAAMMAHNDVAGAQAVMLKELQTEFGGSAEAAGKTFAGQLQILKNSLEDVKQKIGTAVLPILQAFIGGIENYALPALNTFGDWFSKTIGPVLQGFASDVGKVMGAIGKFGAAVQQSGIPGFAYNLGYLGTQLGNLLGVIGSVGGMIISQFTGPLSSAGGLASKVAEEIRHLSDFFWNTGVSVKNFADSLNKMDFGEKIDAVKQFGSTLSSTFGPPIKTIISLLGGQFKETLNFVGTSFKAIGDWIKTSVAPALASAMPGFMQLGAALLNVVPFLLQVREVGMQLVEGFLTHVAPILGFIIPPLIRLAGILSGVLAGAINTVVTVGSAILTFFTKTQLGGDLLKATMIALAVPVGILGLAFIALAIEAIAGFIAAIPGMVAGFIAGATGAWSMAAGVIALTWPILAVIGVIALVILAIQNWGSIVNWLKGIWAAFSSWFMSALGAVGNFFHGVWDGIVSGLKTAWNAIVNVVKAGAVFLLAAFMAPIVAIAGAFIWLYNHNTYFKRMIDAIVNVVKAGLAWLRGIWQNDITWLVGLWNNLVGFATVLWDNVSMQVKIGFERAILFVQGVWEAISTFFVNAWDTYIAKPLIALWTTVSTFFSNVWNTYIVKPLTAMWKNVSTFFSSVWANYIAGPLGGLWNQVSKWFTDLGTGAMNSGKNFINMLVSGIKSGAGQIWNAVVGIAQNIWKALGFHSPAKEGPGSDADTWMPNLVKMLSTDLVAGAPKMQTAANQLAKPIALALGVSNSGALNSLGGVNLKSLTPSGSSTLQGGSSSTTNNSGGTITNNYTINITVPQGRLDRAGAKQIADEVIKEIDHRSRSSGNFFTNTSGGRT